MTVQEIMAQLKQEECGGEKQTNEGDVRERWSNTVQCHLEVKHDEDKKEAIGTAKREVVGVMCQGGCYDVVAETDGRRPSYE